MVSPRSAHESVVAPTSPRVAGRSRWHRTRAQGRGVPPMLKCLEVSSIVNLWDMWPATKPIFFACGQD